MVWLGAFFSPAVYWLLMLLGDGYHVPLPPASIVLALFCLITIVALAICGLAVWLTCKKLWVRVGWLVFTLVAMVFQLAFILYVLGAIIVARISYAQ